MTEVRPPHAAGVAAHRAPAPPRGGALRTAPWRRAPLLLLRRPVVALAIAVASAILAIAAASGPLFLSTVATASVAAQGAQSCPEDGRPTVTALVGGARVPGALRTGTVVLARHGLPGASAAADGYTTVGTSLVHLFTRAGALGHVQTLTPRTGAAGVWLPNTFAAKLGVTAGSTVRTTSGVRLPVAGIYRDMAPNPFALANLPRYWCNYTDQIVATVASDAAIAATPIFNRYGVWAIADPGTVARASDGRAQLTWSAPLSATRAPYSAFLAGENQALRTVTALWVRHVINSRVAPGLHGVLTRAAATRSGMTGSIVPIAVAGGVVAGLLVGGAGLFWSFSRRREIDLLVSRGVGPAALAAKAVLETLPAALVGSAGGVAAAIALVRSVGPSQVLEPGAAARSALVAAAALLGGLLLIAAIGASAGRDRARGRRSHWLARVPWEAALLAGAGLALALRSATAISVDHTIVRVSPAQLLLPLLGAAAALALVGRAIGLLLPRAGRAARRAPTSLYLAMRRMSRSRTVVVALLVGIALPCCLQSYASTVSRSISSEVTLKYETNLGAPHVLQIYGVHGALFDPRGSGTQVVIYDQDVNLAGQDGYVLGVDPATFTRFAYANAGQRAAVARLQPSVAGGAVPTIVVNADGLSPHAVTISHTRLRLAPIASMPVFPGLRRDSTPMLVVNSRALAHVDLETERQNQIWTDAAHYAAARQRVGSLGYSVLFETDSDVVIDRTGLLPVTWIFGYLRALAVLIGVVAIAGLVFGLAARTRRQRVSYVLGRRMGVSRRAHLGSLVAELAVVIGLAWVAGCGLGVSSFGLVVDGFDVYPSLAPAAALVVPRLALAATLIVAAGLVVVAAIATQLLADRARPAEILRLE